MTFTPLEDYLSFEKARARMRADERASDRSRVAETNSPTRLAVIRHLSTSRSGLARVVSVEANSQKKNASPRKDTGEGDMNFWLNVLVDSGVAIRLINEGSFFF